MKYKELIRILKQNGWIITSGGKHDMAKHPNRPGEKIPIPRHIEIEERTARGIIKSAGL